MSKFIILGREAAACSNAQVEPTGCLWRLQVGRNAIPSAAWADVISPGNVLTVDGRSPTGIPATIALAANPLTCRHHHRWDQGDPRQHLDRFKIAGQSAQSAISCATCVK